MFAGASAVVITPPGQSDLSGYVARVQPATGVHDDLYARALCLRAGDERLLWLHCDLIGFDQRYASAVRKEVADRLGLALRQTVLSATHTHSGPPTVFLRKCGEVNGAYLDFLREQLLASAVQAQSRMESVNLVFAEGTAAVAVDRRKPSAFSHVDHRLPVLGFRRRSGEYLAVWSNYAVHNVALGAGNRLVSADIAGQAARVIQNALDGKPMVLFTNGACGNLNPGRQSDDFTAAGDQGTSLGEAVLLANRRSTVCGDPALNSRQREIELRLDVVSREQIEAEFGRTTKGLADRSDYVSRRILEAMALWRDDACQAATGCTNATLPMPMQVVKIGPVRIVAIGAEVFSRFADDLRAGTSEPTYVVGYANGCVGYLPFAEAYVKGGYEVNDAHKYYGTFRISSGGYEVAREAARELLLGL